VLYGQWIKISGFVRADDSFDEAAYGKKVALAVREKGAVDAALKLGAAERARQEKARAAEAAAAAKVKAAEALATPTPTP